MLRPASEDFQRVREVLALIRLYIRENRRIPAGVAEFSGTLDDFAYNFEGEDDLLHLAIERRDKGEIAPEDAQEVAKHLLGAVPPALIWSRPGTYSHHFYFGHESLIQS